MSFNEFRRKKSPRCSYWNKLLKIYSSVTSQKRDGDVIARSVAGEMPHRALRDRETGRLNVLEEKLTVVAREARRGVPTRGG